MNRQFDYIAHYILLLETLGKANAFPEVALLDSPSTIDVALVLDIGNSRTCGLLVQTNSPNQASLDMTKVRRLEIRDMSRPHKVYNDAF